MEQASWPARVITFWILANLFFVGAWDVLMLGIGNQHDTISYALYSWDRNYPIIGKVAALVVGHLLFPLVINHNGNGTTKGGTVHVSSGVPPGSWTAASESGENHPSPG